MPRIMTVMLTLGKPGRRYEPITIDAPFYQAGLAGYSDAAMRVVARRHGCPYCITEAMLDHFLIQGGKGLDHARLYPGDHGKDAPLCGQLMGSHPADIAAGAKILVDLGYDVVDVNLACPVKKIKKKARGGHLLSAPDEAIAILEAVIDAVGEDVPLTVKLRRAYDDSPEMTGNFHRILQAVIDLGYSGATVHSRTVQQKYIGPGSWDELRQIVEHFGLRKPNDIAFTLGGSGDIWQAPDIFRMLEQTGVHWVSVARGCIGNPWFFQQARALMRDDIEAAKTSPTIHQQRDVLLEHFQISAELHGEHQAGRMMRKFGIKFSRHHPQGDEVKKQFISTKDLSDWQRVLDNWYAEDGPGAPYKVTVPDEAEYV
ncbi:MAG: tRNA-dihydrouridine synthase family protein, partial [Planctomycetota bacterium]